MVDEETWGRRNGGGSGFEGLFEARSIDRAEVGIGNEDVGGRGQATDQVLCDVVAPQAKISDDALPTQDANLGRLGHGGGQGWRTVRFESVQVLYSIHSAIVSIHLLK